MNPRFKILGRLAAGGGYTITLFLGFPQYMPFLFGPVWTPILLTASVVAIVAFVVSEFFDARRKPGVRGVGRELGFALVALAPLAVAAWWFRTHPDGHLIRPHMISLAAFAVGAARYWNRANEEQLEARRRAYEASA